MPDGHDVEALKELVRQGERRLDAQLAADGVNDQKTDRLMTLGTAIMGGSLAIAGLVASRGDLHLGPRIAWLATLLGAALVAAGVAMDRLLQVYTARDEPKTRVYTGWGSDSLEEAALERRPHAQVLVDTVRGLRWWIERNEAYLLKARTLRRQAAGWLAAGAGLLFASFLYATVAALI